MEDVNSAWKMGISMCVLCAIISMGLIVMLIGRSFWNGTANTVDRAAINVGYADAYALATKGEPVPVAAMFRVLQNVNMSLGSNGMDLTIVYTDGTEKTGATADDLSTLLAKQGYFSYGDSINPETGEDLNGRLWAKVTIVGG